MRFFYLSCKGYNNIKTKLHVLPVVFLLPTPQLAVCPPRVCYIRMLESLLALYYSKPEQSRKERAGFNTGINRGHNSEETDFF